MTSTGAKRVGQAVAMILLMLIVSNCALKGPYRCYLGSYPGRIVDIDTGDPIEGAVVHVTYTTYGASAAGAIGSQVTVRETLTDANGEYLIPEDIEMHECFSGKLHGQLQIFKPGYARPSHSRARKLCPEEGPEEVPWADEPRCLTEPGRYLTWELPRLKTKEERERNLNRVHPAVGIPNSEQSKLRKAISEERVFLGFPPLTGVELGEMNGQ